MDHVGKNRMTCKLRLKNLLLADKILRIVRQFASCLESERNIRGKPNRSRTTFEDAQHSFFVCGVLF